VFEQVRRKPGRGVSPRDVGVVVADDVTADGARYSVAWAADGSDPTRATWHTAAEIEWLKANDKCWRG
jgi:hypothetical protein